jgi:hypothetical protein
MSDLPWPSYDHRFKWIFVFVFVFLEIEGQLADECIIPKNNAPTWGGGRGAQAYHTTMSHASYHHKHVTTDELGTQDVDQFPHFEIFKIWTIGAPCAYIGKEGYYC